MIDKEKQKDVYLAINKKLEESSSSICSDCEAVEQYKKGLLEWLNKLEEVGEEKRLKAIMRNDTENTKFWEGRTYGYTHTKEKVLEGLFDNDTHENIESEWLSNGRDDKAVE